MRVGEKENREVGTGSACDKPAVQMWQPEWGAHAMASTQASWLDSTATGTQGTRTSSTYTDVSSILMVCMCQGLSVAVRVRGKTME